MPPGVCGGRRASPRYAARRSKQLREAKSSSEKRNDIALQRWSLFDHLGENISTLLNYLRRFIFFELSAILFFLIKKRRRPDSRRTVSAVAVNQHVALAGGGGRGLELEGLGVAFLNHHVDRVRFG